MQHWSRLDCPGDSPKVRSGHAAVCVNYGAELPQLLVIGGMDEEYKSLDDTWLLDVKCQKWREVSIICLYLMVPFTFAVFQMRLLRL